VENGSGESSRRRFIRRLTTLGAAGGVGVLLSEHVAEKPLIGIAQAASGDAILIDETNNGADTTELDSTLATSSSGAALKVVASATTAGLGESPTAVYAEVRTSGGTALDGPWPFGVWGHATGTSGMTFGVFGYSESQNGMGVMGRATGDGPDANGVYGESWATQGGCAISGWARATSGYGSGVHGRSDSTSGQGVDGDAAATSGSTAGVRGHANSPDGAGVDGHAWATNGWARGVVGFSESPDGAGVDGHANATQGFALGVVGFSDSPDGAGVWGYGSATSGYSTGVGGESPSPDGTGVWGHATATSGSSAGVGGRADSPDGTGVWGGAYADGGVGVGGAAHGNGAIGVWAGAASGWPSAIPLVAHGTSGQTAPLQQWHRPDLGILAVVDAAGNLGVGTTAPARSVHLQGSNACFRMDRNANSAAFILTRTSSDFNTIWKTFYVGVDASGVDNGSFFIGDRHNQTSGASEKRLIIDNTGNIVPPTASTGSIGTSSLKWRDIWCTNLHQGDLLFENNFTVTEDAGVGLAFKNDAGEKIAVLDREGNLYVKGRVVEGLPS
jgi:hypothetical protein